MHILVCALNGSPRWNEKTQLVTLTVQSTTDKSGHARLKQVDSATLQGHFNDLMDALTSLSLWKGKTQLTLDKIIQGDACHKPLKCVHRVALPRLDTHPHFIMLQCRRSWFCQSCVFPFHRGPHF